MSSPQRRTRLIIAAVSAIAVLSAGAAIANNTSNATPADKAVASGSTTEVFGPGEAVTLLSAEMRTSKPTDLLLQAALECSILTKLQTGPSGPGEDGPAISTANASATIRGWIEIDDDPFSGEDIEVGAAHRVVPVVSSSAPPQDGSDPQTGTVLEDAATFCNRTYERTVQDGEDPLDGIDRETDYIDTKTATAFNWVLLNAGSGIHHVRLMGELTSDAVGTCERDTAPMTGGNSCTEAYVGNRTLIIEPTKMANNASVS